MLISFLRTVFLYLLLVLGLRLMGKRQLGEMEPSEFVVTMMAANLSTAPIENPESPMIYGLIAIATILCSELTLSTITMCSLRARNLFCGRPVILIDNGKLMQENLRRTRITLDELFSQLRQQQVMDLSTVQYGILETNGCLSVFLYGKDRPATAQEACVQAENDSLPLTLIEEGRILEENLLLSGKDRSWLQKVLADRGADVRGTCLLTLNRDGRILFVRREGRS